MRAASRDGRTIAAGPTGAVILAACLLGVPSDLRAAPAQENAPAELTTRETEPTFRIEVQRNLVLTRVVVRDAKGRAAGNLRKEDFRLFDNGKPQTIAHFSVEVPSAERGAGVAPAKDAADLEALPETALAPSTPQRFLALYFDDIHMNFEDIAQVRPAAERYLASALSPGDRVAIYTSSGQVMLDFTDDQGKLHETFLRLLPRPIAGRQEGTCPEVFDYQAYLIVHANDPYALSIATEEAYHCNYEGLRMDPATARANSQALAMEEAMRVLNSSQMEMEHALRGLEQVVRRLAAAPGQRSIVLISPGFLTVTREYRLNEIVERALRSNVIINTFDSQGLFAPAPLGDASRHPVVVARRPDLTGKKGQLVMDRIEQASQVLRILAYDSGGEFFHNSNDLDEGFRKVGSTVEVYYVLGFSPQNLKLDGRFHSLKVTLGVPGNLTVQARRGYYAPQKPQDPLTQAKEEIEQALFSRDELNELPIEVHTQFFKLNHLDARLSVLTRLDLRFVRFRKENGRNLNNLKLVTVLFDRDGKYVTGREKTLEFRLLDGSLEKLSQSGITTKASFNVRPGTYLVRQVVRDAEGAQLSALNRTVEIPF